MIEKLHYITQEMPGFTHSEMALRACEAGVKWVQLRLKDKTESERRILARETKEICQKYGATFIVNDFVELAVEVGANGVHLGQEDMCPLEARKLLPQGMIIGATANTFEQVSILAKKQVDYMGVGPFRFTASKRKLSPVLGINGFRELLEKCKDSGISIPIIAIGGIQLTDIGSLIPLGVHGVALASAINQAAHPQQLIHKMSMMPGRVVST